MLIGPTGRWGHWFTNTRIDKMSAPHTRTEVGHTHAPLDDCGSHTRALRDDSRSLKPPPSPPIPVPASRGHTRCCKQGSASSRRGPSMSNSTTHGLPPLLPPLLLPPRGPLLRARLNAVLEVGAAGLGPQPARLGSSRRPCPCYSPRYASWRGRPCPGGDVFNPWRTSS